jgi:membrane fusion protein, multidrug efflux system
MEERNTESIVEETKPSDGEPPPRVPVKNSPSNRRRWLTLAIVVLLCALGFLVVRRLGKASGTGSTNAKQALSQNLVSVTTDIAKKGSIGTYINALGSVTALNTVTVKSRVDGQLISVNYREGQFLQAGSLLAEIDPRPFQAQLTQAEGQYQRDQSILNNALLDLDRYRTAYSKNAIPKQQLDTQEATVHQYEGIVKNDQGQIDNVKLQLLYCQITAPISGRAGLRLVDPGNIVHATDTNGLLVITQLQPIAVVFSVAEDNLPQIQQQLRAGKRLLADAFDRSDQTKIATGYLASLDNEIDAATGTIKLKAIFSNQNSALFPNQFVNARLLISTQNEATLIPTSAIQRNSQGPFVYVVKPDHTIALHPIKVGTTDDNAAAVDGVEPGDLVATDGFDKLQAGMKVNPGNADDANGRSKK